MKNDWAVKTLGEVCNFKSIPHKGKLPYVGMEDVESHTGRFLGALDNKVVKSSTSYFDTTCVLYGKLRPYLNKVLLPNFEGHCSTEFLTLRPIKTLCREYLSLWLRSDFVVNEMTLRVTGTRMPRADLGHLKSLKIPIPRISEQKRIVKILDEKFEAIEELRNITQEQMMSTKELFESRLNGIFVDLRKSTNIKKFGEVCDFVRGPFGGSLKKSFFKKDGFAVYEQRHAIYNQFDSIRYYIDEKKFKEMGRFELVAGDLIMSCSGTMGKVAIVPKGVKRGIINQALLKLTPDKSLLSCNYLKMWMESQDFQKSLSELTVGAAIKNVASVKVLKEISLPLPDLKIQDVVIKEIYELSEATKELEAIFHKKITALEELKKSYSNDAFSGKL